MKGRSAACLIGRRRFIGGALATGAVLGFPAIVSGRNLNSRLSHAAVGTGNMAFGDLKSFLGCKGVEVTVLCDTDAKFLAEAKKLCPHARTYRDWRELLAAEGDRIDSLNVSTADHSHAIIAANAIRRGKHVYCQKPLCKFLDEARLLRRLAAEKGVVTQLGTQYASGVSDLQAIEMVRSGVVGPISRVCMYSTRTGGSRGARAFKLAEPVPAHIDWETWIGPAPMRPYAAGYHPKLWRHWRDFGNGWVGDLCIHMMSAPWQGLGLGRMMPLCVKAHNNPEFYADPVYRQCWPRYSHIEYTMPGVPLTDGKPFKMDWYSGIKEDPTTTCEFLPPPELEALFAKTPLKARAHEGRVYVGEKGWILAPHQKPGPVALMKDGKVVLPADLPKPPNHYQQFVSCCLDGTRPRSDFAWTTYMSEAIIIAGVAEQIPDVEHRWDPTADSFHEPEADKLVWSRYRAGWELDGLGKGA